MAALFGGGSNPNGPLWSTKRRETLVTAPPALPTPPDAKADQAAAEAAAQKAKAAQRAKKTNGRRQTLLTNPNALGQAPVQRSTLLGL